MAGLKHALKEQVRQARSSSGTGVDRGRINVAGRANVVVARNVGDGGAEATTAHQRVHIRQAGSGTWLDEEAEVTTSTTERSE